jgi:hypothetical protein
MQEVVPAVREVVPAVREVVPAVREVVPAVREAWEQAATQEREGSTGPSWGQSRAWGSLRESIRCGWSLRGAEGAAEAGVSMTPQ